MASSFTSPVTIDGVPISPGGRYTNPWSTVYYVDADDGVTGSGQSIDINNASSTIQAAVTAASGQDVIYIRPRTYTLGTGFARYTEDVSITLGGSGGSGVTATNAGMCLIGITPRAMAATDFLGVRWKFATATPLTIDTPCVHIENIGFFVEDATYAINLRCNGATRTQEGTTGFSIYNCAIKGDGKIYANGGNELCIVNCRFQAKYDGTTGGIQLVGSANACARPIIKNCEFIGGNANNMATAPFTTAAPVYDLMMRECYFAATPDSGIYINIAGTTSDGLVANCYFGSADINARCTGLVAGVSGVFSAALFDQSGIDDFAT